MKRVYPRWRGEHARIASIVSVLVGLSPLARGTLSEIPGIIRCIRFIPAGAGNTGIEDPGFTVNPVYPRWRGEHPSLVSGFALECGLSPLARGTQNCDCSIYH
ncbi:hypothetical protein SEES8400_06111 [Salmonella enterica subsp. enterica serovar Senftenberg str. ATCC 8400]|nr:hypothetical protein SEES8400_06111 [Salmonella enterica subsp. enterica serovar Senftenberg str. ATCC 8400]